MGVIKAQRSRGDSGWGMADITTFPNYRHGVLLCSVCGKPIKRPVLAKGDKRVIPGRLVFENVEAGIKDAFHEGCKKEYMEFLHRKARWRGDYGD